MCSEILHSQTPELNQNKGFFKIPEDSFLVKFKVLDNDTFNACQGQLDFLMRQNSSFFRKAVGDVVKAVLSVDYEVAKKRGASMLAAFKKIKNPSSTQINIDERLFGFRSDESLSEEFPEGEEKTKFTSGTIEQIQAFLTDIKELLKTTDIDPQSFFDQWQELRRYICLHLPAITQEASAKEGSMESLQMPSEQKDNQVEEVFEELKIEYTKLSTDSHVLRLLRVGGEKSSNLLYVLLSDQEQKFCVYRNHVSSCLVMADVLDGLDDPTGQSSVRRTVLKKLMEGLDVLPNINLVVSSALHTEIMQKVGEITVEYKNHFISKTFGGLPALYDSYNLKIKINEDFKSGLLFPDLLKKDHDKNIKTVVIDSSQYEQDPNTNRVDRLGISIQEQIISSMDSYDDDILKLIPVLSGEDPFFLSRIKIIAAQDSYNSNISSSGLQGVAYLAIINKAQTETKNDPNRFFEFRKGVHERIQQMVEDEVFIRSERRLQGIIDLIQAKEVDTGNPSDKPFELFSYERLRILKNMKKFFLEKGFLPKTLENIHLFDPIMGERVNERTASEAILSNRINRSANGSKKGEQTLELSTFFKSSNTELMISQVELTVSIERAVHRFGVLFKSWHSESNTNAQQYKDYWQSWGNTITQKLREAFGENLDQSQLLMITVHSPQLPMYLIDNNNFSPESYQKLNDLNTYLKEALIACEGANLYFDSRSNFFSNNPEAYFNICNGWFKSNPSNYEARMAQLQSDYSSLKGFSLNDDCIKSDNGYNAVSANYQLQLLAYKGKLQTQLDAWKVELSKDNKAVKDQINDLLVHYRKRLAETEDNLAIFFAGLPGTEQSEEYDSFQTVVKDGLDNSNTTGNNRTIMLQHLRVDLLHGMFKESYQKLVELSIMGKLSEFIKEQDAYAKELIGLRLKKYLEETNQNEVPPGLMSLYGSDSLVLDGAVKHRTVLGHLGVYSVPAGIAESGLSALLNGVKEALAGGVLAGVGGVGVGLAGSLVYDKLASGSEVDAMRHFEEMISELDYDKFAKNAEDHGFGVFIEELIWRTLPSKYKDDFKKRGHYRENLVDSEFVALMQPTLLRLREIQQAAYVLGVDLEKHPTYKNFHARVVMDLANYETLDDVDQGDNNRLAEAASNETSEQGEKLSLILKKIMDDDNKRMEGSFEELIKNNIISRKQAERKKEVWKRLVINSLTTSITTVVAGVSLGFALPVVIGGTVLGSLIGKYLQGVFATKKKK